MERGEIGQVLAACRPPASKRRRVPRKMQRGPISAYLKLLKEGPCLRRPTSRRRAHRGRSNLGPISADLGGLGIARAGVGIRGGAGIDGGGVGEERANEVEGEVRDDQTDRLRGVTII